MNPDKNLPDKSESEDMRAYAPVGRARARLIGAVITGLIVWVFLYSLLGPLADFLTFTLVRAPAMSRLGSSVGMFLYQAPNIFMILVLVIFAAGIARSFFSPERTREMLSGRRESAGSVMAAMLGIVTPFCACSAVPLFIGFVEAGVPLGVTFSFLIAAPMVNEVAVVMLLNMFGWKVAALYAGTGLLIAIAAGWVISRLKMDRFIEKWVLEIRAPQSAALKPDMAWDGRVRYGLQAVRDTIGRIWPYVLAGIAVGAVIHGYMPDGAMASLMGKDAWWSVPAAVLLGVPMYANAAGIIPVVQALMEKGAALGTALAFMMAVIALSLPEAIILRKVLRPQLIAVFIGVVTVGILLVGILFNLLLAG